LSGAAGDFPMTDPIRYEVDDKAIVTLTFDAPGSAVNTMTAEWQRALTAAVDRIVAEKDKIRGVILASAKKTFFAGAELKDVLQLKSSDAPALFREIEALKRNFRRLETQGRPVVAAVNGAALGGGFEVALAAHYRICLDDPKIQLGFPEVTLGLLPGATGVTKMVRLLGLMEAMPYLIEGRLMQPQDALKLGLVHELARDQADLVTRARSFIEAHTEAVQPWDDKNYRLPGGGPASPKISQALAAAPAMLTQRTRGLYPAPEAIMACMVEGALVDFDTALRIESRYLAELAVSQVAKNMITAFFFNLNAIKAGAGRPPDVPRAKFAKVGILGAGMMGGGIAYANAMRGVACVLKDVAVEAAEKGKAYTAKLLDKRIKAGRMDEAKADATLSFITPTATLEDLKGCDLIIEAVFEKRELKAQVTREAEPLLAGNGIFASNTSTLPITGLALASARPDHFIGLHFFSPVDKMQLVEIIVGKKTSAQTLARAYDYVQQIGKVPIVVNDARGFFTSRVFGTFVTEGLLMLAEGIPAPVIENAGRQAGMPVGPLEVNDATSLSLSWHVMLQTRIDLAAEGVAREPQANEVIIDRMVNEFKRPGRAGGGGFYDYLAGGEKTLWPELKRLFEKPGIAYDMQELKDRILYRQAIETARCLEENVLRNVADANIGSIFGIGFPAWTGGALQFINSEGPAHFVKRSDELAAKHGKRFAVPQSVRDQAAGAA
jgi:3-hydroxyacyl-CoA dehydrogenase / enoyl-CoA hydratase / 3-hydroxybutyryl-CoA epimerase